MLLAEREFVQSLFSQTTSALLKPLPLTAASF
jgi:hypothetical protein